MSNMKEIRSLIGTRPIVQCGSGAIIMNSNNQILLLRRKDNDSWAFPGGGVELGETVQETAIREVFEETGLKINNLELFGVCSGKDAYFMYPDGNEVFYVITTFITNKFEGHIQVDFSESTDCRFFTLNDLPENINSIDRIIMDDLRKYLLKDKCKLCGHTAKPVNKLFLY